MKIKLINAPKKDPQIMHITVRTRNPAIDPIKAAIVAEIASAELTSSGRLFIVFS